MGQLLANGRFGGLGRSTALRVAAGIACFDVIAQDVSKTPLNLYRETEQGPERVLPSEHPVARLLKRGPNEWMGTKEWLRLTAFHLSLYQEATTLIRRRERGDVGELYAHIPERCRVEVNTSERRYFYRVTKASNHDDVQLHWAPNLISAEDVLHFRGRTLDGLVALPSTHLGREVYETLKSMRKFVSDMFERGGMDILALTFPHGLSDEQFKRIEKGVDQAARTSREQGKPLILEGEGGENPEVKSLTMASADQGLDKTFVSTLHEACRLLRVPPHKIFALDDVKYDNIEPMDRHYVNDTLSLYFDTIEEVANRRLLTADTDADLFCAFDRDAAYSIDPAKKAKMHREELERAAITVDEYRSKRGWRKLGGAAGSARLVMGAAVMIDENNEIIMQSRGDPAEEAMKNGSQEADEEKQNSPDLRLVG